MRRISSHNHHDPASPMVAKAHVCQDFQEERLRIPYQRLEQYPLWEETLLAALKHLAANCTMRKLSWMLRPERNVLWLGLTKTDISFLNYPASNLEKSLAKLWIKLIGRKSLTWIASLFLGMKVMRTLFRVYGSCGFEFAWVLSVDFVKLSEQLLHPQEILLHHLLLLEVEDS